MEKFWLNQVDELCSLIEDWGFLPFFKNEIEGFSVEEHTPPSLWFQDGVEGPWEWKGAAIRKSHCAYGKFYHKKACFISKELFPDFANLRRDGYDYDARMDEGLVRRRDNGIMEELSRAPSLLSTQLKALVCFTPQRKKEFEGSISHLQMMCYVNIADFEYAKSKAGKEYGWGLARYTTPEAFFGEEFTSRVYARSPEESKARLMEHLTRKFPRVKIEALEGLLRL